ncbi:prepilin peptidase, partial [Mariniblastus sp.]|nr:prepilin peptidase [Mariniblastus sp.]
MLNEPNKLTREAAVRNESCLSTTRVKVEGPYSYSLVGEYSRILLLLVSLPLTIWLLQLVARQSASVIPMVAALVLVASLLSERGLRGVRVFLLVAMTVNVFSSVINPNAFLIKPEAYNPLAVPNVILLICLATASFFETANVCRDNGRPTRIKLMCLGFVLLPALVYVVGVPVVTSWLEAMAEGDSRVNARDPNWTTAKEIALRAAKFGVFLIFVYFGACVGSFLNVVAYCIPRGEAVGFRNSICPVC